MADEDRARRTRMAEPARTRDQLIGEVRHRPFSSAGAEGNRPRRGGAGDSGVSGLKAGSATSVFSPPGTPSETPRAPRFSRASSVYGGFSKLFPSAAIKLRQPPPRLPVHCTLSYDCRGGNGETMSSDKEAKEQIIQITNELFSMGLLTATGGNISAARRRRDDLDHPEPDVQGRADARTIWCASGPTAPCSRASACRRSSTRCTGAPIEVRPGTTGAVHTHAPIATAFGICNQTFPPINTDAVFLRDTLTVPWYMPGSKELADAVGEALKKSRGRDPAEPRPDDGRPESAQSRDARHDARGDREDRALHQAVRRHREPAAGRVGRAARASPSSSDRMGALEGKVAVVTGSAFGNGRGMRRALRRGRRRRRHRRHRRRSAS